MEEIIRALTRLAIERTKNPFIRFIVRKTSKSLKIKAYKELREFSNTENNDIVIKLIKE